MRCTFFTLAILGAVAAAAVPVVATDITLGEQDFQDGDFLTSASSYNAAQAGEPSPFNSFRGSDGGSNATADITFTGLSPSTSASITIGFADHDSQASGSQVESFSVDGVDLTALLDAEFESRGGAQAEYNVYTVILPALAVAELADGSATFSIELDGPGLLQGANGQEETPNNGAGFDFATLSFAAIPEPAIATGLLAMGGLVLSRRRRD